MLRLEGYIQNIDFPRYYRERGLLERAEHAYKLDIQSIKQIFGEKHELYNVLNTELAVILSDQGRLKEAEELEVQIIRMSLRIRGDKHPLTLISMTGLASTFRKQGRWKEAEELEMQVMETR